jgi:hypothetical protein
MRDNQSSLWSHGADTGEETNRGEAAIKESQAMWDAFGAFLDK